MSTPGSRPVSSFFPIGAVPVGYPRGPFVFPPMGLPVFPRGGMPLPMGGPMIFLPVGMIGPQPLPYPLTNPGLIFPPPQLPITSPQVSPPQPVSSPSAPQQSSSAAIDTSPAESKAKVGEKTEKALSELKQVKFTADTAGKQSEKSIAPLPSDQAMDSETTDKTSKSRKRKREDDEDHQSSESESEIESSMVTRKDAAEIKRLSLQALRTLKPLAPKPVKKGRTIHPINRIKLLPGKTPEGVEFYEVVLELPATGRTNFLTKTSTPCLPVGLHPFSLSNISTRNYLRLLQPVSSGAYIGEPGLDAVTHFAQWEWFNEVLQDAGTTFEAFRSTLRNIITDDFDSALKESKEVAARKQLIKCKKHDLGTYQIISQSKRERFIAHVQSLFNLGVKKECIYKLPVSFEPFQPRNEREETEYNKITKEWITALRMFIRERKSYYIVKSTVVLRNIPSTGFENEPICHVLALKLLQLQERLIILRGGLSSLASQTAASSAASYQQSSSLTALLGQSLSAKLNPNSSSSGTLPLAAEPAADTEKAQQASEFQTAMKL